MKIYLNWKGPKGLETVDEFAREPGQSLAEFRGEVRRMVREYRLAGMGVYPSRRPCRAWAAREVRI